MKKNNLIVYGVYTKKISNIIYYNNIQSLYRILTSTLLLASFAAIGFTLSLSKDLLLDRLSLVVFLGIISLIGTMIFWRLDILFIERIIISVFFDAYQLEKKNKWLTQVHHRMAPNDNYYASPNKQVWFYIGCGSTLIIEISIASFFFINEYYSINIFFLPIATMLVLFIFGYYLLKRSKKFKQLFEELNDNK